ncbi:MAG: TetR/AcrR family transcriptional regulator [Spirochaetales bacterium]|nr:TetR/AcrR family transcriptional regulator [Spirochaetales bacterium]
MKKEKKEHLLEQTVQFLLEEKPFNMENLATELGVVRKTLYNHFRSREGLIEETIEYFFRANRLKVEEIIDQDLPYLMRGDMLLKHLAELIDSTEKFCAHREIRDSDVEDMYRQSFDTIRKKISLFVKEGQLEGWLRSDTPLETMAHMVFSLVLGSIHNRSADQSYSSYLTLLMQGLAGDRARTIERDRSPLPDLVT